MSVRRKALLLVGVVLIASLVMLHVVAQVVLVQGYRHLEDEDCLNDLRQAQAVIVHDVAQLRSAASDWARWDDSYTFVQHPNNGFIHENLLDQTFRNLRLNAIVFVRPSGEVVFAKGFDLAADHESPVPPALLAMLQPGGALTGHHHEQDAVAGLVSLPDGAMLVAVLPILPSDMAGEPRGVLLWGRYFDKSSWNYMTRLARLPLALVPLDSAPRAGVAADQLESVIPLNDHALLGHALLHDVTGHARWELRLKHPRELYQQGLITVRSFLACLVMASVAFGVLVLVFVDRLVLRRLESLGDQVGQIGRDGDLSGRVVLSGRDELGRLAAAINSLLNRLERATKERLALEEQIREAQKTEAVGRLAGGIAHDFNNILTAVLGYCGQLVRRYQLDRGAVRCVEEVEKLAERAATLTRQLLAFSRRQVLQPQVLELNAVVSRARQLLQPVIGENIKLVISLADDLGRVSADPAQLEQVLINLSLNSREAMPRGGTLTLQTANAELSNGDPLEPHGLLAGPYVTLCVSDTGVGMTAAVKAHLFEPFFTTKGVGQGAGLGLATCYGIIKQSGGEIRITSEVGQGTTVTIFLPRVTARPVAPRLAAAVHETLPCGSETVMVVEDEPAVREISVSMLRDLGYRVLEAGNGEEALRIAESEAASAIDLLLTDMVMPLMGGAELATNFTRRHPQTKVLFTSGYTDTAANRAGILNERVEFLQKPFTSTALARKVRQVLGEPAAV